MSWLHFLALNGDHLAIMAVCLAVGLPLLF